MVSVFQYGLTTCKSSEPILPTFTNNKNLVSLSGTKILFMGSAESPLMLFFKSFNIDALPVNNYNELMRTYKEFNPDVVILDVELINLIK